MQIVLLATALAGAVIAGGCAPRVEHTAKAEDKSMVQIEVLGFGACPNTPEFRERITAAARDVGGYEVVAIDQESLAPADPRRGYPGPTALVGGSDLFGLPAPSSPAMGCRVYPGGLPTVADIVSRLERFARAR